MAAVEFRDLLSNLLARQNLGGETVALLADVISVDARFNATVAGKKGTDEDVDFLRLVETYEPCLDPCVEEISCFESFEDEGRLAAALRAARDTLRRMVTTLGGTFQPGP